MNRSCIPTNLFELALLENGRDRWIEAVSEVTGASPDRVHPDAQQAFRFLLFYGWRRFHYPMSVMYYPGGPTIESALEAEGHPVMPTTPVAVHTRELEDGKWAFVLNRTTIGVVPLADQSWVKALVPFGLKFRIVDPGRSGGDSVPEAESLAPDADRSSDSSAVLLAFNAGPAAERYLNNAFVSAADRTERGAC